MAAIGYDSQRSHFTPAGDLEDESFLDTVIMDTYDEETGDEESVLSDDITDDLG